MLHLLAPAFQLISQRRRDNSISLMNYSQNIRRTWCALGAIAIVFFASMSSLVFADSGKLDSFVTLNSTSDNIDLFPYIRIVPDANKLLSYKDVLESGDFTVNNGINYTIPASRSILIKEPSWIVFEVQKTLGAKDSWVLDFGNIIDGQIGFASAIKFYSTTAQEKINFISGRSVRLSIAESGKSKFAIFINPLNNSILPLTINPKLISYQNWSAGSLLLTSLFSFLIFAAGCFVTIAIIKKWLYCAAISGYYFSNAALFALLSSVFTTASSSPSALGFILAISSVIFALSSAALLLKKKTGALYSIGAIVAIVAVFTILGSVDFFIPKTLLFTSIILTSLVGISILFLMSIAKNGTFVVLNTIAWSMPTIGLLVSAAYVSGFNLIAGSGVAVCGFWVGLILQFVILIFSIALQFKHRARKLHILRQQKIRKTKALEQIRIQKESEGQSHLLHAIDRERELMAELRERDKDRNEQMRIAKNIATEANQAKSAFLAVVSHEIRTPMTGILGMLRLLEASSLNRDQKDYVVTIRKSSDSMMHLLNDILDLEKIGSGQMDLEAIDFDLHQLINSVVTLMSAHAKEKNLELNEDLSDDLPRYLVGDPARLRQVILNLISNAIKFTNTGSVTVNVSLASRDENSNTITFAIKDTGIGIPEEAKKRLFKPFSQAETSTSRKYGGTGLGLAICKEIVGAMGSNIEIESQKNKGSTFKFTIKMPNGHKDLSGNNFENDKNKGARDVERTPQMKILVVEDNEINRKILRSLLDAHGHKTTISEMAEKAIEVCKKEKFDVIFMDVQLGGMSGLEATKILRSSSSGQNSRTPIIALTGNVGDDNLEEYYSIGMNGLVPKPIRPFALYTVLKKVHANELDNPVKEPVIEMALEDELPEDSALENEDSQSIWSEISNSKETFGFEEGDTDYQKDSIDAALQETEQDLINKEMLKSLCSSIGKDQLMSLMDDFWKKSQELVSALIAAAQKKELAAIGARGHELKGMAGNFGMSSFSDIASQIETAAKTGDELLAIEIIGKLTDSLENSKMSFDTWSEEGEIQ